MRGSGAARRGGRDSAKVLAVSSFLSYGEEKGHMAKAHRRAIAPGTPNEERMIQCSGPWQGQPSKPLRENPLSAMSLDMGAGPPSPPHSPCSPFPQRLQNAASGSSWFLSPSSPPELDWVIVHCPQAPPPQHSSGKLRCSPP